MRVRNLGELNLSPQLRELNKGLIDSLEAGPRGAEVGIMRRESVSPRGHPSRARAPSEPLQISLTAPLVPTLNVLLRKHWSYRTRMKKALAADFRMEAMLQLAVEDWGLFPLQRARVEIVRLACGKEPDRDNLVSSAKLILDALVAALVLKDDSPDCLVLSVRWERVARAKQRTLISVTQA